MLPPNLYLETAQVSRGDGSNQSRTYGRFKLVNQDDVTVILDKVDITIKPTAIHGKEMFTIGLTIATCLFLTQFLRPSEIMRSSGSLVWTEDKQLCEAAEACRGIFRVERDDDKHVT